MVDNPSLPEPMTEEQLEKITVGPPPKQLNGPVTLVDYDPNWPRLFLREAERITAALGGSALRVEHVGSTSVPGLVAKPMIDILLVVANSQNEKAYVPALEAVGYVLRVREPDWHEHRMFKGPDNAINLHVFSRDDDEIDRMLIFRDWLRENPKERETYAEAKRELARRDWKFTQNYADAKTEVIKAILAKANDSSIYR